MATPNMTPAGANDLKKKIIAASFVPIPAKVIGNTPVKILSEVDPHCQDRKLYNLSSP